MKISPTIIRNTIVGMLLLLLGVVIGLEVANGKLPALAFLNKLSPGTGTVGYKLANTAQPTQFKDVNFQTFWEVWRLLEKEYVEPDKLQVDKMVDGAIGGMTGAIGDPYTMYLPPSDNQRSGEDLAGAFYGVGIELGYVDGVLAVMAPLSGSPAEKAGVKAKDLILHVKDESKKLDADTSGWTLNQAVDSIRGKKDTQVVLTLLRRDEKPEPFDVTITRGEIVVPTTELSFTETETGPVAVIKLSKFGERTPQEWNEAVTTILAKPNVKGVVLDVRNNPGGFFDGAILVASEFIDKGIIVSQKGRKDSQDFPARGKARLAKMPVVVLVNRGSASSSEIVSGALRDVRNAKLIGEKTFGKGTVQDRLELENGGGMHITTARFLLPKGEWIHDTGIPATIEVEDNPETPEDEVLQKALSEL